VDVSVLSSKGVLDWGEAGVVLLDPPHAAQLIATRHTRDKATMEERAGRIYSGAAGKYRDQFTLRKMNRRQRSSVGAGVGVLAALVLLAVGAGWLFGPGPAHPQPVVVRIAAGTGRRAIARQLTSAGVLRTAWGFELWSVIHRRQPLQAGTYRFPAGITPVGAFKQLAAGEIYAVTVAIPEGFNRFDIAHLLASRGLATAPAFLQATADPGPIRDLDPAAVSLEGYLFPATYPISPGTPAGAIAALMLARFRQEVQTLHPQMQNLHAWVTLASMIEKETAAPAERALIAGVFDNRLARGMPLQSDPTVTYAALSGAPLYNTYQHTGLPPGPIANPGAAALLAAAHPDHTPDLYFVSNGHGGHRFARTLSEQDHNIHLYRLGLRPQAAAATAK